MKAGKLLVCVSVADLRRRATHSSELLTQAALGVELDRVRTTRDRAWHQVRLPDGYIGWVRSWSVVPVSLSELSRWKREARFHVSSRSLALRQEPSRRSMVTCELVLGTKIPRVANRGEWVKTTLPDSTQGWLEGSGLDPVSRPLHASSSVIRTALRFAGAPYLWGGTTPWGCDCSGLVQTVYAFNSVPLPRDAGDQFRATRDCAVDAGSRRFRAGDLLFFGASIRAISHVAISTGGYGFIHSRGCVREGSLRRGELGYSHELSRFLCAAARPLDAVKKDVDKKNGLQ